MEKDTTVESNSCHLSHLPVCIPVLNPCGKLIRRWDEDQDRDDWVRTERHGETIAAARRSLACGGGRRVSSRARQRNVVTDRSSDFGCDGVPEIGRRWLYGTDVAGYRTSWCNQQIKSRKGHTNTSGRAYRVPQDKRDNFCSVRWWFFSFFFK
jgi:hypothetical protein